MAIITIPSTFDSIATSKTFKANKFSEKLGDDIAKMTATDKVERMS